MALRVVRTAVVLGLVACLGCARGVPPRVPHEVQATGVHRFPGATADLALSATIATLGAEGYEAREVDRSAGTLVTGPKVLRRWTTKDAEGKPTVHEETLAFRALVSPLTDGAQVALDPHAYVDGVEVAYVTQVMPETRLLTHLVTLKHELDTTIDEVRAVALRRRERTRGGVEPPPVDDPAFAGR